LIPVLILPMLQIKRSRSYQISGRGEKIVESRKVHTAMALQICREKGVLLPAYRPGGALLDGENRKSS
jgi:hypothetical protein